MFKCCIHYQLYVIISGRIGFVLGGKEKMKLLCSDFDGTFGYKGVDDEKRQAISKWRSHGNVFALVSGRNINSLISLQRKYSFDCDYLLAHNGAVVAKGDGTVISSVEFEGDIAFSILKQLFENGCLYAYIGTELTGVVYANKSDCDGEGKYSLGDLPQINRLTQICAVCQDTKTGQNLYNSLQERFGDVVNPIHCGRYIYIVKAAMNKAKGIYNLIEHLGLKHEDVIVVGDNLNDKDMIKAFRSYAMENGVDEIKNLADDITNGVAELITKELVYLDMR